MNKENIYFSIIVPCYNASKYLERCIKSINKQTFQNYEVIFIDDCSKDDTYTLLKEHEKFNPKFKIIKTPKNSGPAAARNQGIKIARGNYICFLDSDDWWSSKKLSTVFEYTVKFKDEIFCHNELFFLNSKYVKKLKYQIKNKNFYNHLLLKSNQLSTSATVVKLNFVKSKQVFFNESKTHFSVEDYDYWLKLTHSGATIKFINKFLGTYNIHETNISLEHNMHNSNVLNVIRDHSFNIQKISMNKKKIWKEASFRFYLNDIKYRLNNSGLNVEIILATIKIFTNSPIIFSKHLFSKFFR